MLVSMFLNFGHYKDTLLFSNDKLIKNHNEKRKNTFKLSYRLACFSVLSRRIIIFKYCTFPEQLLPLDPQIRQRRLVNISPQFEKVWNKATDKRETVIAHIIPYILYNKGIKEALLYLYC